MVSRMMRSPARSATLFLAVVFLALLSLRAPGASEAAAPLLKFSAIEDLSAAGVAPAVTAGTPDGLVKLVPFTLDPAQVRLGLQGGRQYLYINGARYRLRNENGYLQPRRTVIVDLPPGSTVTGVRLVCAACVEVSGKARPLRISPVRHVVPKPGAKPVPVKTAQPDAPPPFQVRYYAGNTGKGIRVSVWVYPVAYGRDGCKAALLTGGTIELYYRTE